MIGMGAKSITIVRAVTADFYFDEELLEASLSLLSVSCEREVGG
jgi:hypothetical protein